MKKKSKIILVVICCFIFSESCKNPTEKEAKNKDKIAIEDKSMQNSSVMANNTINLAKEFLRRLEKGQSLGFMMSNKWTFIYHEDNRCDGSTDGLKHDLPGFAIDKVISISVENDGEGWACAKKKPSIFNLDFVLKEQIKQWDRFIIAEYSKPEENIFYLQGAGESDYIIIYFEKFNDEYLITKLEYRSEDPG
jgi:hypothetical protein